MESDLTDAMERRIVENGDSHGCNVVGTVTVRKVPGTMMITAHSNYKSLSLEYLNMSHIVHHYVHRPVHDKTLKQLSGSAYEDAANSNQEGTQNYGAYARSLMRTHKEATIGFLARYGLDTVTPFLFPLDQSRHVTDQERGILTHYLKVVRTFATPAGGDTMEMYQHQVHSDGSMQLPEGGHPSLNFTYDLSPLSYEVSGHHEPTADFLTSTCAIVGGVFTVIGLFDNVLYHSAANVLKFMRN